MKQGVKDCDMIVKGPLGNICKHHKTIANPNRIGTHESLSNFPTNHIIIRSTLILLMVSTWLPKIAIVHVWRHLPVRHPAPDGSMPILVGAHVGIPASHKPRGHTPKGLHS